MRYDWDKAKSKANYAKHGIEFRTAALIFDAFHVLSEIDRVVDGEVRWASLGLVPGTSLLLYVAHTWTDDDVIRIISARKATTIERRKFEDSL